MSSGYRRFDGMRVLHVTGNDLDEIASQALGPVRVACQNSHFEPPRCQQTHDLHSKCPGPTGD
jgi:hypothetical protein